MLYVSLMLSDSYSTIRLKGLFEAPREKLLDVIADLLSRIAWLERRGAGEQKSIKKLRDELKKIREELEAAQRWAHRQAGPFGVEDNRRVKEPRRPGRKVGHRGSYRSRPEQVDESIDVSPVIVHIVAGWLMTFGQWSNSSRRYRLFVRE